jgi:hypothetical protein
VGPLRLGETQSAARRSLPRHNEIGFGFDNFCLYGGWGIRGAYLKDRFAILLTANPFYIPARLLRPMSRAGIE